jgi:hypothetical protein
MAVVQHIFSGFGPPTFTPSGIGHHYINKSNSQQFLSVGIASSGDWVRVGTVNSSITIAAGTGLTGGGDLSANRTLSLANTSVAPGSYGSSTQVPTFTVDAQGRITLATQAPISILASQVSNFNEAAQDAVGFAFSPSSDISIIYNDILNSFVPDLLPTTVVDGGYGTGDTVPSITVDTKGRITAVVNTSISIAASQVYDFTTAAQDEIGALFLPTANIIPTYNPGSDYNWDLTDTNVTPGTYGDGQNVAVVDIDQKGRINKAYTVPISVTITSGSITDFNDAAQSAVGGIVQAGADVSLSFSTGPNTILALLNTTGVIPGTKGSATQVPQFNVDSKGRITSATNIPIGIVSTQVTDFTEAAQDAVAGMLITSTEIAGTYNDIGNTFSYALQNSSVQFSKMQNIATQGILGRSTAGTGVIEQLTLGSGLRLNGLALEAITFFDFGSGIDPDPNISGTVTLTRDMFYANLTITATGILNLAGFRAFVAGTATNAGTIRFNGNPGNNGTGAAAGAAAGAALVAGSVGGAAAGSAGATGGLTVGLASAAAGNSNPAMGGSGGAAGTSGNGAGGAGAAGGVGGTATQRLFQFLNSHLLFQATLITGGAGGKGGSSGGGSGTVAGAGGGGGGGGGGVLFLATRILNNTGIISANGGAGGSQIASLGLNTGGGSGGGGGGGGWVYVVAGSVTSTGTIQALGGSAGTGGAGNGTGTAGAAGVAGSVGKTSLYNCTTRTWTVT